jgi:hypothetical protein
MSTRGAFIRKWRAWQGRRPCAAFADLLDTLSALWIVLCLGFAISVLTSNASANDAVVRSAYCFSALQASAQNALQHQYRPNQIILDALQRYQAYLLLHMTDPDTTVIDSVAILAAHQRGRPDFYACQQQLQLCSRYLHPEDCIVCDRISACTNSNWLPF